MKKFVLLIIVVGYTSSAYTQDRKRFLMDIYEYNEEMNALVNRVIDSLGGKYQNLNMGTYQVNGSIAYSTQDTALFDFYYYKENWSRLDQKIKDDYRFFVRHGSKGWQSIESADKISRNKLSRLSLEEEDHFSFYRNNLFLYDKHNLELYYEGEVEAGELSMYILRLAGFSYGEEMYYISKKTYRPVMKQVHILKRNYQAVIHYTLGDYLKIKGIWLPHEIGIKKEEESKLFKIYGYNFPVKMDESMFIVKD